jgi:septal ring factor EnvC (AmiA/AmiB activator)
VVKIHLSALGKWSGSMISNNSAGVAKAVVPLTPKSNTKSQAGDELDRAGQAILGVLDRAAGAAEAKYRQAAEMTHKLSDQLRAAEDRIRQLEANVRHHQDRADRAEKWLYQISVEIEQKFFNGAPAPALRR